MFSKKCLSAIVVGAGIFSGPTQAAVDPVTVTIAAKTVSSLFAKSPGDPHAVLLQANRDALIGVHNRLDGIEASLAKIMQDMALLRGDMLKTSLEAQSFGIGNRIAAIGQVYVGRHMSIEQDRIDLGTSSPRYNRLLTRYEDFLANRVDQIAISSTDLALRQNQSGLNALAIVASAYIELAMEIEYNAKFGGSGNRVMSRAKEHIKFLDTLIDEGNPAALPALISGVKARLVAASPALDKTRYETTEDMNGIWPDDGATSLSLDSNKGAKELIDEVTGTYVKGCMNQYARVVPGAPPAPRVLLNSYYAIYDIRLVERKGGRKLLLTLTPLPRVTKNNNCENINDAPLNTIRLRMNGVGGLKAPRAKWLARLKEFENVIYYADVLLALDGVRDAVLLAKERVQKVADGDFSAISLLDARAASELSIDGIMREMAAIDTKEKAEDAAKLTATMKNTRREIYARVAEHDQKIKDAFEQAAKAAKFNATLNYLNIAAQVYQYSVHNGHSLTKKDREYLRKIVGRTLEEVEKKEGRKPAGLQVLIEAFEHIQSVFQEKAETNEFFSDNRRMQEALAKVVASIPVNQTRDYHVIYVDDRFWGYEAVVDGKKWWRPTNARVKQTVTIGGGIAPQ